MIVLGKSFLNEELLTMFGECKVIINLRLLHYIAENSADLRPTAAMFFQVIAMEILEQDILD